MEKISSIVRFWKRVFSNWRYILSTLIIFILFYVLNVLIANFNNLISFSSQFGFFGTIKFFFNLMLGFFHVIPKFSFISLIIISFLIGMLFSLIFYRIKLISKTKDKKFGFVSAIGIFLGAFAPGCAACGLGLASLLGLSGTFLALFPLKGLELSILAIILLAIAIFKTSDDSCKIMTKKAERGLE